MTQTRSADAMLAHRRPIRLTLAGLWAERLVRAFWPLWSLLIATLAALAFGLQNSACRSRRSGSGWWPRPRAPPGRCSGLRAFRLPTRAEALARLDARCPASPIAALSDTQAIGAR